MSREYRPRPALDVRRGERWRQDLEDAGRLREEFDRRHGTALSGGRRRPGLLARVWRRLGGRG